MTLGLVAVIGSVTWLGHERSLQTAAALIEKESGQFSLRIENRTLTPDTIEVQQGDTVEIHVDSDEYGEFHISGYELLDKIDADHAATVHFVADLAGTFSLELHPVTHEGDHEDIALGSLIVHAR